MGYIGVLEYTQGRLGFWFKMNVKLAEILVTHNRFALFRYEEYNISFWLLGCDHKKDEAFLLLLSYYLSEMLSLNVYMLVDFRD